VQIHSCPTFASFLPSQYFTIGPQGARAKQLISHIDRELARHTSLSVGAYFTAVCGKAALDTATGAQPENLVKARGENELLALLENEGIRFEVHEHERVRNISDVLKQLDIAPQSMAKAILAVIRGDEHRISGHVVFLVPGSHQLDIEKASSLLGRRRREWRFATQKEVKSTYGLEIGGVPPFGYGPNVRVLMDRRLASLDCVYCGIGNPRKSIRLHAKDLVRISNAELCDISLSTNG
jgi:prolyl-tRNA editing enzyme YbaK/EbsC (Cys-tRNA(Pro) deacylase)